MTVIKTLFCSCCGAWTKGRQWHNRDIGYGLCGECANRLKDKEEMERCYGKEGYHYFLNREVEND